MRTRSADSARRAGFTLLEIMAVVAIFALVAGIAMPNFSRLQTRRLDAVASDLVAQIDLARQRAIVTGVPHRLVIDIDGGGYRIEWQGRREADEEGDEASAGSGGSFDNFVGSIDLSAPRSEAREFQPLSGFSGRFTWIDDSVVFAGIETTGGWIDRGESFISFEQDGTADPTTIVIDHEAGHSVTLEILPLSSTVRVVHDHV
jgi:type II secretion system protein H